MVEDACFWPGRWVADVSAAAIPCVSSASPVASYLLFLELKALQRKKNHKPGRQRYNPMWNKNPEKTCHITCSGRDFRLASFNQIFMLRFSLLLLWWQPTLITESLWQRECPCFYFNIPPSSIFSHLCRSALPLPRLRSLQLWVWVSGSRAVCTRWLVQHTSSVQPALTVLMCQVLTWHSAF